MEKIDLKIEKIALGGAGIGYHNGLVVFVPGTIPGEMVEVKLVKEKKNHAIGKLLKLKETSPNRIPPACPYAAHTHSPGQSPLPHCPGCTYQHMPYKQEVEFKQQQFCETLKKFADINPDLIMPPISSPEELYYRNKMTLHTAIDKTETSVGYFLEDNQTILDLPQCPLANRKINEFYLSQRHKPGFFHTLKDKMKLTYRVTEQDGVIFWRNNPPKSQSWLKQQTLLGMISFPVDSFFQVNPGCADILIQQVFDFTKSISPDHVIDLFCGVGIFSIAAARYCSGSIIGVDCDQAAIQAASYNARQHGIKSYDFRVANAFKNYNILNSPMPGKTLLITDPPRSGMSNGLTQAIGKSRISDIVYISCAPDTLARDIAILQKYGYRLQSTQLFDMFPRTSHFESISHLIFDNL